MSDHHGEDEHDEAEHTQPSGGEGEQPKSDVAQEIEDDPAANPDEQHLKDLKGA